jgi:putative ABC transport system permease protein
MTRLSLRIYRALLVVAPRSIRHAHADEMEELFADRLSTARGVGARTAVWAGAIVDLLRARLQSRNVVLTIPIDERKAVMIGSDVHYALRSFGRQPGATALVVLMLALGIAANVAVFSLVNGLFLRPFPFAHPEQLVYINETAPRWNLDIVGINYPDFDRWRKDAKLFQAMALYQSARFNLADARGAERVPGAQVTWDFPRVLGIEPLLGRFFTPEEDRPKGPRVVVIGSALWHTRFGGDRGIIGSTLRLDGAATTIVGVMPAEGGFPEDAQLWVPMAGDPNPASAESYSAEGLGRLKPGVTAGDADRDLKRAHQPIWDTKDKDHTVSPFAKLLREQLVSDFETAASTVGAAVAILLLIACANVAAVMLARALARRREMGIRLALGSSRARILRQLLVENIILAVAGGVIGLTAGQWAIGALIRMIPDELPHWAAFQIDARVIAFSLVSVVATVILFGWAPALHALGGDLRSAVHASTNGTTGAPRGRRTLSFIVAGEFALAALLLVCGTLLVKAFDRVRSVDPGFRADHLLTFSIPISEAARPTPEHWMAFWDTLTERTRQLPGVDRAGLVSCAPFGGCHLGNFFSGENAIPRPDGKDPVVLTRSASAGYFEALGSRLREGRFLEEPDGRDKRTPVVVVNESLVRAFWGEGATGVGRRIKFRGENAPWMTIVGVVVDVKHYGLERPMRPGIYLPLASFPGSTMTMAVHTAVDPATLGPAVREMVRRLDPELPVVGLRPMEEWIQRSMALRAAFSWMLAIFAALAFVLAIGGAYGVATYLVTQRTREIGIRVALGARTADIFRSVVGRGLGVVAAGVMFGLVGSALAAKLLADVLFGVSPHDATVLVFVSLVLIGTGVMANGLPARRAARIDPMRTLRTD